MASEVELKKTPDQLSALLVECKIKEYQNKKILNVGFKNWLFLKQCQINGLSPTGITVYE